MAEDALEQHTDRLLTPLPCSRYGAFDEGIRRFLRSQRWYAGPKDPVPDVLTRWSELASGPASFLHVLATVEAPGGAQTYQLVLSPHLGIEAERWQEEGQDGWHETLTDPQAAVQLLSVISKGQFSATTARIMGVEQSNTSVVFDDQLMLKVFRRVTPGPNPDCVVPADLALLGFDRVAAPLWVWEADGLTLAVLTPFVAGGREGWEAAVDDVLAWGGVGEAPFAAEAGTLGHDTARMHLAMADAYGTCPASGAAWADAVEDMVRSVGFEPGPIPERLRLAKAGPQIRVHGDLHLGQVLRNSDGWWFLDFEGEPNRPVAERLAPSSAFKDVAGMLRSFDYAAGTAAKRGVELANVHQWAQQCRYSYLHSYLATPGISRVLPASGDRAVVLAAFELEKAAYEVGYERTYRPEWEPIPVAALTRLTTAMPKEDLATMPIPEPDRHSASENNKLPSAKAEEATGPSANPEEAAVSSTQAGGLDPVAKALSDGTHTSPHSVLGFHDGVVSVWRPGATTVGVLVGENEPFELSQVDGSGLWRGEVPSASDGYKVAVTWADGTTGTIEDPYRFWPTLGDVDLHLFGEGRHRHLWEAMGARVMEHQGTQGVAFTVWAPSARAVRVVGDWNLWDGRIHPMRSMGSSGVWELFIPEAREGDRYKFEIQTQHGYFKTQADPMARRTEMMPGTASVIEGPSRYQWADDDWLAQRSGQDLLHGPMSVYELHLGSWRWMVEADGFSRHMTYRELADALPVYLKDLGFTHVEFLPVAEHPYGPSWGYQVTGYYAPTARFGSPDDFCHLVDALHRAGIGVLVDWVPAHFPKDSWALARFDGSALYEHEDPRKGEHPDWGTLVFNVGRNEVRNFLTANALYWLKELHVDGLRVDAVASMLYLDYSRNDGEWVANEYGGRENLDSVHFFQHLNTDVYGEVPGAVSVAEESTAWPGVSTPVYDGGLGFGFKWNMGWMHDTLEYFSKEPIYRSYDHDKLTFGLVYAFSENFILPLSHDEVVHGKGSLLNKMPGDDWQKFANLRALYAWMWAHPGKQMLFMGGEIAPFEEWSESRSLPWHLLDYDRHRGVQNLVRDLNHRYVETPALWQMDREPQGFRWIDASDSTSSVLSFVRSGADGQTLVCVANLTPVPRTSYRIGVPQAGLWREVLNTDALVYDGSGMGNGGEVWAEEYPYHHLPASATLTLPPLSVLWLVPNDMGVIPDSM